MVMGLGLKLVVMHTPNPNHAYQITEQNLTREYCIRLLQLLKKI